MFEGERERSGERQEEEDRTGRKEDPFTNNQDLTSLSSANRFVRILGRTPLPRPLVRASRRSLPPTLTLSTTHLQNQRQDRSLSRDVHDDSSPSNLSWSLLQSNEYQRPSIPPPPPGENPSPRRETHKSPSRNDERLRSCIKTSRRTRNIIPLPQRTHQPSRPKTNPLHKLHRPRRPPPLRPLRPHTPLPHPRPNSPSQRRSPQHSHAGRRKLQSVLHSSPGVRDDNLRGDEGGRDLGL